MIYKGDKFMKKYHQIIFISASILVFGIMALVVYFSEGVTMRSSRYYRLDAGVAVEFLTDSDNIVDTIYPVDVNARIMLAGEKFVGLNIEEAVPKYLELCAKLGYIDVDSDNNGVQISVSSTFTQAIENEIYVACSRYFLDNEIYCVIAESDADLALYNEKKEKGVSSIEKLVVIKSVMEKTGEYAFEDLARMTESELMEILQVYHEEMAATLLQRAAEDIAAKDVILAANKEKYDTHILAITNDTKRNFADKYAKYKKSETYDWELDFAKKIAEKKKS